MKAYILSTYEEHGAEDVHASLSQEKITEVFNRLCDEWIKDCRARKWTDESMQEVLDSIKIEKATLSRLLSENIPNPDYGHNLGKGWGGFQLHIIELE